jgi:hypothetical protein
MDHLGSFWPQLFPGCRRGFPRWSSTSKSCWAVSGMARRTLGAGPKRKLGAARGKLGKAIRNGTIIP